MNSSMCFGSGAEAEYAVTGSSPSATATSSRSPIPRQSAAPSLWICQCMKVVRASIFCIRYMPTLRVPVFGSIVITAGSVMNGAGSPGQQRWIGSRSRSMSSPVSTTSWQAPRETVFGIESAIDFSFLRPRTFSTSPCGGCSSSTSSSRSAMSSSRSTPKARHIRRSVPNWFTSSGCAAPFGRSNRSAGPPAFTVRSTISVASRSGSTSAATRTSSPSRSSRAIQSRRSAGGATAVSLVCRGARVPDRRRACGFIGGHVARELREHGFEVRDDWVDLRDASGLRRAIDGCEAVFHVAALYSFDAPAAELEAVNVGRHAERARRVPRRGRAPPRPHLELRRRAGPCAGRVGDRGGRSRPHWELVVPYKRTKLESERLVLAVAGLDAVVVNPTTPVGEGDTAPTPTGRMVRGVASGRYRAYVATAGVNLVDVRDVARGHLLALDRGRRGERYLLGGENLPLREAFARIARAAGRPRPRIRVPYAAVRAGAALGLVNRNEALLARLPEYFSSAKAQRELGLRALADRRRAAAGGGA